MKKRLLSLLLTLALLAGLLSLSGWGAEQTAAGGLLTPTAEVGDITVTVTGSDSETAPLLGASSSSVTFTSAEDAGAYLREQMVERIETVTLSVQTAAASLDTGRLRALASEIGTEIITEAVSHTGEADEGDYLAWQYGSYLFSADLTAQSADGTCTIQYTFTLTYYTTRAQEDEMDTAVAALVKKLGLTDSGTTDLEKIAAVYDYICENVTYDYDRADELISHTAYAALIEGTAVCQGYAVLFYRLCLEAGIDARLISGTSGGQTHGWNIVLLDGMYYYMDSTWDAGVTTYSYYMMGSVSFSRTHQVDSLSASIVNSYPISAVNYFGLNGVSGLFQDAADADAYYYEAVYWAADNGITTGTTTVAFSPDTAVTRAQLVTFLYRLTGGPMAIAESANPFTDVSREEYPYYYDAILWAYYAGITTGKTADTFAPDDTVTRAELAAFLYRFYGEPDADGLTNAFSDVGEDLYYTDAVLWSYSEGITTGTSSDPLTFSPDALCTRAQAVTMLYRAENR